MTIDMTTGRPLRRILAFCGPALAGGLFQQLYSLADAFLVGRILGNDAFAAVGSTGALCFLVLGFAMGLCSGLAIPIGQAFGAGDEALLKRRAGQALWIAAIASVLIGLAAVLWTDDLLVLSGTPEELLHDAYAYALVAFAGTGATILYNLASASLRALGDSRTPTLFLAATVVLNIGLDVLCMAGLGLGTAGAAVATLISQLASGIACLAYIKLKVPALVPGRHDLMPGVQDTFRVAMIGLPMGLQFAVTAIGSVMVQGAVNGLGTTAVAAVAAGSKVYMLMQAPLEAVGLAMAAYCAQNLGAGDAPRVRDGVRAAYLVSLAWCAVGAALSNSAGMGVAALFLEDADPAILIPAKQYLMASAYFYPALAAIFVFRNALQGMGFSGRAMVAGAAELIGRGVSAFVLVGSMGYRAVCLACPIAWICADIVLVAMYMAKMRELMVGYAVRRKPEVPRIGHPVAGWQHG